MTIQAINQVCCDTYGCGILAASPVAALWVCEKILTDSGLNVFKKVSSHRNRYGVGTTFPEYGTELFATM